MSDLNKELSIFDECSAMASLARQKEYELKNTNEVKVTYNELDDEFKCEKFEGESRVVRVIKYNEEPVRKSIKYCEDDYNERKAKRLERLERELAEEKRRQALNDNFFGMLSNTGLKIVKGTIYRFENHDDLYKFTFDRITIDDEDTYDYETGDHYEGLKTVNLWFSVVSDYLVDEICIEVILTKEMIKGE